MDTSKNKDGGVARQLQERIQSDHFRSALIRLIKHNHVTSGAGTGSNKISDVEIAERMQSLASIELYSVRDLRTHLMYEKRPIVQSETRKTCFSSVVNQEGRGRVWEVYLEETSQINHDLLIPLSEVINRMLGGILK